MGYYSEAQTLDRSFPSGGGLERATSDSENWAVTDR